MGADDDQIASIRARLYAMVSANPSGPDADQARQLLGRLPHYAAGGSLGGMQHGGGDAPDSITLQAPQGKTLPSFDSGGTPMADLRPGQDKEKPLIKEDPIGTALTMRAMGGMRGTMPEMAVQGGVGSGVTSALNSNSPKDIAVATGAGAAMPLLLAAGAGLGRKMLSSEGGRASQVLADRGLPMHAPFDEAPGGFKPDLPVKGGDFGGMPSGKAVEHLEAMKASPNLPKGTTDAIEAEIARIRGAASSGDPAVDAARDVLKFKGPHMGELGLGGGAAAALLHAGHGGFMGIPALAMLAARNAAPIAGRAAVPLTNFAADAAPLVKPLSILGSPLLQAATRGE